MIKLVILDVDGVMTDGKKYYDRDGNVVLKNFCDKDWTAIKRFRAIGIPVVFLTGDPFNATILKNRNLPYVVNRGDGFVIFFSDSEKAILCSIDIQTKIKKRNKS